MNKRRMITMSCLLVAITLIVLVLRSRGHFHPTPDIISVSPDSRHVAHLYQLSRLIDKNYRVTVHDSVNRKLMAEYFTPDEMPLNQTVQFRWNTDSTAVLLVGDVFSTKIDSPCDPNAYLMIEVTGQDHVWTAASQDSTTPRLTNADLARLQFCTNE